MLAWLKTQEGPPPGEAFGGTAVLQTGQVNYVSAEFTQGEYAMVCFVPDAADGRPHTAHGMVREFRVN